MHLGRLISESRGQSWVHHHGSALFGHVVALVTPGDGCGVPGPGGGHFAGGWLREWRSLEAWQLTGTVPRHLCTSGLGEEREGWASSTPPETAMVPSSRRYPTTLHGGRAFRAAPAAAPCSRGFLSLPEPQSSFRPRD